MYSGREFFIVGVLVSLLPVLQEVAGAGSFGDVFAWGVSTSAFQTEGAWNVDGIEANIFFIYSLIYFYIYKDLLQDSPNRCCKLSKLLRKL